MKRFYNSFIHSYRTFKQSPFKKTYSEALPTPVRLTRTVFKREKNERDKDLGKRRNSRGRPFQVEGPTTEKAGTIGTRKKKSYGFDLEKDEKLDLSYTQR